LNKLLIATILLACSSLMVSCGLDDESLDSEANLDLNNDGVLDVFYEYENDKFYELVDRNFDKKIDESHYFDSNARIIRSKTDENFDGILETDIEYEDGSISRVLVDSDNDGIIDLIFSYRHGVLLSGFRFYHGEGGEPSKIGVTRFSFGYPSSVETKHTVDLSAKEFASYVSEVLLDNGKN